MRWILLDVALVGLSLALLGYLLLGLWRRVKTLLSAVAKAGDLVSQASGSLELDRGQPTPARLAPLRQPIHPTAASRSPGRHR